MIFMKIKFKRAKAVTTFQGDRMRRLLWRIGRRLYMIARGEPLRNLPESSGEIYMQTAVAKALAPLKESVVFDVGANLGQWSTQYLNTANASTGYAMDGLIQHAFEPVPATQTKLTEVLAAAAHGDRVQLNPFALSNQAGKTRINILGSATCGRNSIVDDPLKQEAPIDSIEIETQTLDGFCERAGISHINFVKIDAEGHDFRVIEGAASLISTGSIDTLQFEYIERWIDSRTFLKDVFHFIEGKPYKLCRIRPDRLELLEAWHPEIERFFAANYALVHERALGWFDLHHGQFDKSSTYA